MATLGALWAKLYTLREPANRGLLLQHTGLFLMRWAPKIGGISAFCARSPPGSSYDFDPPFVRCAPPLVQLIAFALSFDRDFMTKDLLGGVTSLLSRNWVKEWTQIGPWVLQKSSRPIRQSQAACHVSLCLSVKVCVSRWLFPRHGGGWAKEKWERYVYNNLADNIVSCKKPASFVSDKILSEFCH